MDSERIQRAQELFALLESQKKRLHQEDARREHYIREILTQQRS